MPTYSFELGTTLEDMVNVQALSVPLPCPTPNFRLYAEIVDLGDGNSFGRGFATDEWKWSLLSPAERDQLRTFCTGASAAIYMKTRTNDSSDTYKIFTGIMHWPLEEPRWGKQRMDLIVTFTQLVEVIIV